MMTKFALAAVLAVAVSAPVERAAAQDSTLGGAIVGGAAGAILGGALGGSRGAAIGAVVGAGTGAAIGAQGEPRPGGYRYYQNGCYVQQPDGSWVGVSPRYCQTVQYAPPPPDIMTTHPAACAAPPMTRAAAPLSAATATAAPARRTVAALHPAREVNKAQVFLTARSGPAPDRFIGQPLELGWRRDGRTTSAAASSSGRRCSSSARSTIACPPRRPSRIRRSASA